MDEKTVGLGKELDTEDFLLYAREMVLSGHDAIGGREGHAGSTMWVLVEPKTVKHLSELPFKIVRFNDCEYSEYWENKGEKWERVSASYGVVG
jgi:hypothetical protein